MRSKRLLALLLTLLLALSCATPVLAASDDGTYDDSEYMLNQFEINLPQLPNTSNTVADVLGTQSATAILSSVTYNNGKTGLYFYPNYTLHINGTNGKTLASSDGFTAGKEYNFVFSTKLPDGMDIDNSLMYEDSTGDIRLSLPVYINGVQSDDVTTFFLPQEGRITVNAWYTVPAAPTVDLNRVTDFDVRGLKLPEAGMTVRDSLSKVRIMDGGNRELEVYQPGWTDVANNFTSMSPSDKFEAGKTYHFSVSFKDETLLYDVDTKGNAVLAPYMDGKPCPDATIVGGKPLNSYPTFNWRYTVPSLITTYDGAVKEVRFYGLTTPCAGEKVSESYVNAYVYFDSPYNTKKILKVEWEELTNSGQTIKLSDDDHFQKGKNYQLHVYVDPGSDIFNTGYDPGIVFSWYAAETYLNNTKVSNGTGGEPAFLAPSGNNSVEFFNSYTCIEPVKAASGCLNEVRIEGLALPADGMTLYQSLTDCVAKGLTITSMSWQELTPDGHVLAPMSNTDRFKEGTQYLLNIYMDAENLKLDERSSPAPSSWVVASVYLNGDLVYNGDPGWSIVSNLDTFCDSTATPSKQLLFIYHYTAGPAGSTPVPASSKFEDVPANAWYKDYVSNATQMGLIDGINATTFKPDGNLTMVQAVKLAACMHQLYTTGKVTLTNGSPLWYQTYAEYARDNGIIAGSNPTAFEIGYNNVMDEPNKIITRQEYAWIFARALPKEALPQINKIPDGSVPDVPQTMSAWYDGIYTLYRAGIVNGSDAKGTFNPLSNIKRSEVAAIVVRMMDKSQRVGAPAELGK